MFAHPGLRISICPCLWMDIIIQHIPSINRWVISSFRARFDRLNAMNAVSIQLLHSVHLYAQCMDRETWYIQYRCMRAVHYDTVQVLGTRLLLDPLLVCLQILPKMKNCCNVLISICHQYFHFILICMNQNPLTSFLFYCTVKSVQLILNYKLMQELL